MTHTLMELPYTKDALAPVISAETLEFHHGKHHKAYVDKLNQLIPGTEFENMQLEEIVRKSEGPIFNNAGQVWNHNFYWKSMSPRGTELKGDLKSAVEKHFGSVDQFKEKFTNAAIGQFGSGWAWLVKKTDGSLAIEATPNAVTPLKTGSGTPLLTCDVWEHAYYIDYRNRRPDYVAAFWKLLNWDFATENFKSAR